MPEVVFARPGSEVTVYCTRRNATNVRWWLNLRAAIPESQYRVVSEHVSAVTWRPSEAGMDVLFCCDKGQRPVEEGPVQKDQCSLSYAKVYSTG